MKRMAENITDKHHKISTLKYVLCPASIPRVAARGQDDSAAGAGAGGVRPRQPRPPVRAAVCPGAEVAAGHLPLQPGPRRPA